MALPPYELPHDLFALTNNLDNLPGSSQHQIPAPYTTVAASGKVEIVELVNSFFDLKIDLNMPEQLPINPLLVPLSSSQTPGLPSQAGRFCCYMR